MIAFLVCGLALSLKLAYGKGVPFKPIEIPSEIKNLTTLDQIEPYLYSPLEEEKRGAIRRLGQIGGQEAIESLIKVFEDQPYKADFEVHPVVKLEIVNALYENGSGTAKMALLDILNTYLTRGPQVSEWWPKRYSWRDGDYISVTGSVLRSLVKWKDDDEVWNTCKSIALDESIDDYFVRAASYEIYLGGLMVREGVVSLENSVRYLTERLTSGGGHSFDWVEGREGVMTTEAIKNRAIMEILHDYGEAALPHLRKELGHIPQTEKYRIEALHQAIRRIEWSLEKAGHDQ